jgi:hypothetical protein
MPGAAPTDNTQWATDGAAEIAEPSLGQKQDGWDVSDKPPAGWLNWWMRAVYRWVFYYGTKDTAGGVVGLHDTDNRAQWAAASGTALTVTGAGSECSLEVARTATA